MNYVRELLAMAGMVAEVVHPEILLTLLLLVNILRTLPHAGRRTLWATPLLVSISIWLVKEVVCGLRAITMTDRLQLCIELCRKLSILWSECELRPLAGLLVKTMDGCVTTVWV